MKKFRNKDALALAEGENPEDADTYMTSALAKVRP